VNASGSALVYSALIGGPGNDFATGIAIDPSGNAYIAGYTTSVSFPVTSAGFQKSFGGGFQDAFVAKLNPSGSGLIYGTYLGGTGNDVANGIAVDAAGEAYVVGYTDSANFPTRSPIYANAGGQGDAFVAKLTPAGDNLAFSTYLGGSLMDSATAVALDSSCNVYVTGATLSANFPVTGGAFQTVNQGSYDAFVSKINSQGTSVLYSTYVGGEGSDQSSSIAVGADGTAYIAGFTYSYHFPLQNPVAASAHGGQEAFAAAVAATGSSLVWSTYLGGAGDDQATGIALDAAGGVYVVGSTFSSDFPTTAAAYRTTYAGGDGFLVKLASWGAPSVVSGTPTTATASPQTFTFVARDPDGFADIANVYFLVSGSTSSLQNSCYGVYVRASNLLYLYNDLQSTLLGPLTPGSSGTLTNSQCVVSGLTSALISNSGTDLTISVGLSLNAVYATTSRNLYLYVADNEGHNTGWIQTGVWTAAPANHTPTVVSGTPANPVGSTQTFSFVARDLDGFADIGSLYFWVTGSPSNPQNSCYGVYVRPSNVLYLYNGSLSATLGPLTPGSSGTLQNSQCAVNGGASALISASGTDLTINIGLSLTGTYATTAQNVYLYVIDNEGHNTGWVQSAAWAVASTNHTPTVVSGTPANPTGSPQTFSFLARDLDGFADISTLYFWITGSPSNPQNSCYGVYVRSSNVLYLYNDSLSATLGPLTPGSSGTLQNSQCMVNGGSSALISAAGTDLTVNIGLSLTGTYATTTQNVYLYVIDNESHNTGWVQTGAWTVGSTNHTPTVVAGTPANPTGSPQTFSFVARDLDGVADIGSLYFWVAGSPSNPQNSCYGVYVRSSNVLYLYNDSLSATLGPLTPGSSGTLQNSQCMVNGGSSALISASGTDLALNVGLSLQGTYATAPQGVYIYVTDNEGHDTGWVQTGTWTVASTSHTPAVISGAPANPTGSPQTFSFVAQDLDGFADIGNVYFWITANPSSPQNSCFGVYVRPSNALYLYNDSLSTTSGPLTAGLSGTLQNSQCIVNGSTSSLVSASGTNLTINIGLSLRGTYATVPQNVYVYVTDNEGHNTGWVQTGAWREP